MAADGSEWQRTVGQRVRALRRQLGWTQQQLAALWTMPRSSVSKIERGLQAITLEQADRLTLQVGVGLDLLVGRFPPAVELLTLSSLAAELPPEGVHILITLAQELQAFWVRRRQRRR